MFVLPLDDIIIGRYGLEGRLQATLNGTTPQFENLNLKLDGKRSTSLLPVLKPCLTSEMKNISYSQWKNKRQTVGIGLSMEVQTGNP